jgi:hypothetical protein
VRCFNWRFFERKGKYKIAKKEEKMLLRYIEEELKIVSFRKKPVSLWELTQEILLEEN